MTHEMNKPTFWPRVLGAALGVFLVVSGLYERFTGQTPIWRRRPIAGWLDIAIGIGIVAVAASVASQRRKRQIPAEQAAGPNGLGRGSS